MHFRPQRAIIYLVTHSFKQNIVATISDAYFGPQKHDRNGI